jgi:hypothetical protein
LSLPRLSSEQMPHMHGTHKEMPSVRGLHSGKKARIFNLVGGDFQASSAFSSLPDRRPVSEAVHADGRARRR